MTTEVIIAIISGIVAVSVALISKTEIFSRKHHNIKKDLELYELLPEGSSEKEALLKYINKGIKGYIIKSTTHRRNASEITIGIIFLPLGVYLSWFFISLESWWLIGLLISGFILLIGIYGIASGIRKIERDEKGNAIKNSNS